MLLTLVRDYSESDCTQGVLVLESGFRSSPWQTIEPPWIPVPGAPCGLKGRSCTPLGEFMLVKHDTEAHPRTFALVNPSLWVYHWDEDVPASRAGLARTVCLLHPANRASELKGCCAIGKSRSISPAGIRMVDSSRDAFAELFAAVPWENGHILRIVHASHRG